MAGCQVALLQRLALVDQSQFAANLHHIKQSSSFHENRNCQIVQIQCTHYSKRFLYYPSFLSILHHMYSSNSLNINSKAESCTQQPVASASLSAAQTRTQDFYSSRVGQNFQIIRSTLKESEK